MIQRSGTLGTDNLPYRVILPDDIEKMIPREVRAVKDLLGLEDDQIISILRHFNWNSIYVKE